MNVFLIDFENVQASGLNGIETLSEDDKVYIFYSTNCKISLDYISVLNDCNCEVYYRRTKNGTRNALDFQLVEILGYLIGRHEKREVSVNYYIVSKDTGFRCIKDNIKNVNIDFCINLLKDKSDKTINTDNKPKLKSEVEKLLSSLKNDKIDIDMVCKGICETKDVASFNHYLQGKIKDGKVISKIIKALKPELKELFKNNK